MANADHPIRQSTLRFFVAQRMRYVFGAAAVGGSLALGGLFLVGQRLGADADARIARAVEDENVSVCRKFGAGPETSAYAACADELDAVRRRHEERMQPIDL